MPSALNIPVLKTTDASFEAAFQARLHWSGETDSAIEDRVAEIIAAVRAQGDAAVLAYTKQFDLLPAEQITDLEITQAEDGHCWSQGAKGPGDVSQNQRANWRLMYQKECALHESES